MQNIARSSVPPLVLSCAFALVSAGPALARPVSTPSFDGAAAPEPVLAAVTFAPAAAPALAIPVLPELADPPDDGGQQARPRPTAVEYSDAYKVRAKIHKYASFATLPLFVTEAVLGQSLYSDTPTTGRGDSKRGVHGAVGAAIGVLFAANTVTGVWNLWEGRHDPNGRTLRIVHGLLMMAADVGFLATANAVPNRRTFNGLLNYETDKQTHRNIAYASMGVATIGYTIMLFGGK